MRISKSVMAVGGVVLAAAAIGFTNPKAVRAAVVAAMVQVTNTASNPVITQSVGQQAANAVVVLCAPDGNAGQGMCLDQSGGGGQYVVPANKSLVITAAHIDTEYPLGNTIGGNSQCNASRQDMVYLNNIKVLDWNIVNTTSQTDFTYPSGVVAGPSSTLVPDEFYYSGDLTSNCGADLIYLYGYLTAN
ncbi:MAG TPA: hypothetical protein VLC51_03760 [Nitrospira sp.]|nr:hypothetical protein [Nitrospira sp.]